MVTKVKTGQSGENAPDVLCQMADSPGNTSCGRSITFTRKQGRQTKLLSTLEERWI